MCTEKKEKKKELSEVKIRCNRYPCFPVGWCKMKPVCVLVVVVFFANVQGDCIFLQNVQSDPIAIRPVEDI